MEEEAEGQRRESIPNRLGVGSRRGEEEVKEKKNQGERKDRKQCVYQQTFGCCQLTARALGCQRKKRELYNQAVIAGGESQRDRQTETETENERGTRGKKTLPFKVTVTT